MSLLCVFVTMYWMLSNRSILNVSFYATLCARVLLPTEMIHTCMCLPVRTYSVECIIDVIHS